jgi:hypothetical protein
MERRVEPERKKSHTIEDAESKQPQMNINIAQTISFNSLLYQNQNPKSPSPVQSSTL